MTKVNFEILENEENPKMIEVYRDHLWQSAFCFALACEDNESKFQEPKLLFTIIGGSDTTLQAMKAAMDSGYSGIGFGYGLKELTQWKFTREFTVAAEKGKYNTFPISITSSRKMLAIVHESLMNNEQYILDFFGNPAEAIKQVFGGGTYGLHLLDEWKDIVFDELVKRKKLEEVSIYVDEKSFPDGVHLYKITLSEVEADELISELVAIGKLHFPEDGSGEDIDKIDNLTDYLLDFNSSLLTKVEKQVKPLHDPMIQKEFQYLNEYPKTPFPVQSQVVTASVKKLLTDKAMILEGEMSTGKTLMTTLIADAFARQKGKKGYHACIMCPPSLTKKWAEEEILEVIPHAKVIWVKDTKDLISYHQDWVNKGRIKPTVPTFFVISFTTMRGDSAIEPVVTWKNKATEIQLQSEEGTKHKYGYYCPCCMNPHHVIKNKETFIDENGIEKTEVDKELMGIDDFGTTRRLNNGAKPANAFCSECGESLWTKRAPTRYSSYKEWKQHEKAILHAIEQQNPRLVEHIQLSQNAIPKAVGKPRKVAAIEYIRRKMKGWFDISIIDEVHEMKSGQSAQGNAAGSLWASSKKIIGATGTLTGGKASDLFYLLWRLFPHEMVKNGYKFSESTKFDQEFGIVEEITYTPGKDATEQSNKQSRGGNSTKRTKILPGISPFVYTKFLLQHSVLVRLKDVWVTDTELIDVPTILIDMNEEQEKNYRAMISQFEHLINTSENGHKLFLPMVQNGVSYPDNMISYPTVEFAGEELWEPLYMESDIITPKEEKLQELVKSEMSEGRPTIVYVRDTGSSREGRNIQPRLKEILEKIGAKVAILTTTTTKTYDRSAWLKNKVENEHYNVVIVSSELVKVGLDLLCTPTIIWYQLPWSLYTVNQGSRRHFRIGQTKECRLFYLAYKDTYQEYLAKIVAQKNKAAKALSGEASSEGLTAMLGGDDDLMTLLIKSAQNSKRGKGTAEEWIEQASDRAKEILGRLESKNFEQNSKLEAAPVNVQIEHVKKTRHQVVELDDSMIVVATTGNKKKTKKIVEGQLTFDLFAM